MKLIIWNSELHIYVVNFGNFQFQDSFSPIIEKMSQKVSWMTGLNTNTWKDEAELLQVDNILLYFICT
jgi:hypothetical protein